MRYLIPNIILFLLATSSYGSGCSKTTKQRLYAEAELVLVGQIIYVDEDSYLVQVGERLKGYPKDTVEGVISNSSIRPKMASSWLIYANMTEMGKIYADICNGSKSFELPFGPQDYSYPKPPPKYLKDPSLFFLFENITHDMALSELYFDIIDLRYKKMQDQINRLETNNILLIEELEEAKVYFKFFLVLLGLLLVFQLFFGIRQSMK